MNSAEKYPGLLRPDDQDEIVMMVATAGHVDHGKTRLVKLLTGCSTDRLKSEQERGLTIELGFAPCHLPGGMAVGIVDVPGHEKFIRNMVAGVSGIELALLVIAADDGVMPQTVEHLQIMEMMGVRRGMVALSKIDMVDEITVELRREGIAEFLQGTFMDGCPICPVSSETGAGFAEFYDAFASEVGQVRAGGRAGIFRMPVERVFTRQGLGTVATGIPLSGEIKIGDSVELCPGGATGKVRGIQCFLSDVESGGAGKCLALNISDIGRTQIERGQVLAEPGCMRPARIFHVRVAAVPGIDPPIRNAEQIKLHCGTAERHGKIYLIEGKTLSAGESGFATLLVDEPVAAAERDQFILRRPSPAATIGGGRIRIVSADSRRPRRSAILETLEEREERWLKCDPSRPAGIDCMIDLAICTGFPQGASTEDVSRSVLLPRQLVAERLEYFRAAERVIRLKTEKYICRAAYQRILGQVESYIDEFSRREGLINMEMHHLRSQFDLRDYLWERILADLDRSEAIDIVDGTLILRAAVDSLPADELQTMETVYELYENCRFSTPRPDELPGMLDIAEDKAATILKHLCNTNRLVRISPKVLLTLDNLRAAQSKVLEIIERDGHLISGEFKGEIDSTRKYALAILEYFDSKHITARKDSKRSLIRGYRERLI